MTKPTPEFVQMLRYAMVPNLPDVRDLRASREWERALQSHSEGLWAMAYLAGMVAEAQRKE